MKCSSLFSTLTLLNANAPTLGIKEMDVQRELIVVIAEITNTSVIFGEKSCSNKRKAVHTELSN